MKNIKTFESFTDEPDISGWLHRPDEGKNEFYRENYDRIIKFVDESTIVRDIVINNEPDMIQTWDKSTSKNKSLLLLNLLTPWDLEKELKEFEENL
jgi:hypothetical protein